MGSMDLIQPIYSIYDPLGVGGYPSWDNVKILTKLKAKWVWRKGKPTLSYKDRRKPVTLSK